VDQGRPLQAVSLVVGQVEFFAEEFRVEAHSFGVPAPCAGRFLPSAPS
jgi:hypothetical protein